MWRRSLRSRINRSRWVQHASLSLRPGFWIIGYLSEEDEERMTGSRERRIKDEFGFGKG